MSSDEKARKATEPLQRALMRIAEGKTAFAIGSRPPLAPNVETLLLDFLARHGLYNAVKDSVAFETTPEYATDVLAEFNNYEGGIECGGLPFLDYPDLAVVMGFIWMCVCELEATYGENEKTPRGQIDNMRKVGCLLDFVQYFYYPASYAVVKADDAAQARAQHVNDGVNELAKFVAELQKARDADPDGSVDEAVKAAAKASGTAIKVIKLTGE